MPLPLPFGITGAFDGGICMESVGPICNESVFLGTDGAGNCESRAGPAMWNVYPSSAELVESADAFDIP